MLTVFSDARCLEHRVPFGFPERPERLKGILELLDGGDGGFDVRRQGPHPKTGEAIRAVHDPNYAAAFERAVERGDGLLDSADNPLSPGTWDAARAAVDAVLHAADWIAEAPGREAFAAVRPPGHHAERGTAMGFCYFNNVAVAAQHLLGRLRASGLPARVAIFDPDVHHGNGTQHLFEDRADVFYASIHQWPFYPGSGAESERGRGEGEGATLNVCMPAGSGDGEYLEAFETAILPALEAFAPAALLVSIGFDAWRDDPLGGMNVSREGYAEWGSRLRELAGRVCGGRLLSVLEGGYDLRALPDLAVSYLGIGL